MHRSLQIIYLFLVTLFTYSIQCFISTCRKCQHKCQQTLFYFSIINILQTITSGANVSITISCSLSVSVFMLIINKRILIKSIIIIIQLPNYKQVVDIINISRTMISGKDDKGSYYPSIDQMWEIQLNNKKIQQKEGKGKGKVKVVDPVGSHQNWYNNANQYWKKSQASYNGVLGGFQNLSAIDIKESFQFIFGFFKTCPDHVRGRVIDCGAGIGRIAKQLLCQVYKTVDIIDQCDKYVQKAKQILKDKNVEHFYTKGLQQFNFQQKYDCVWIQWVISHLTDDDAIKFLVRAKQSLNPNGFILLKQNHFRKGFAVDKQDYSVTRSRELYVSLIDKAGLKIVKEAEQVNWPRDLFSVRMYIIQ